MGRPKSPGSSIPDRLRACPVALEFTWTVFPCTLCSVATTASRASSVRQATPLNLSGWAKRLTNAASHHAYPLMTNHVHLLLTPWKAATAPKPIISLGRLQRQP